MDFVQKVSNRKMKKKRTRKILGTFFEISFCPKKKNRFEKRKKNCNQKFLKKSSKFEKFVFLLITLQPIGFIGHRFFSFPKTYSLGVGECGIFCELN